jgi:hypothetical protein
MLIVLFVTQITGHPLDKRKSQIRMRRQDGVPLRSGPSWLSLVAATTKGIGQLGRVRVKVKSTARIPGYAFRLVVHSYAASALRQDEAPSTALMPIASVQRAVSQEELRSGLELDLVHLGSSTPIPDDFVVYAWVEPGQPDFAYDAALARPSVGALKGRAVSRRQPHDYRVAEVLLTAA